MTVCSGAAKDLEIQQVPIRKLEQGVARIRRLASKVTAELLSQSPQGRRHF